MNEDLKMQVQRLQLGRPIVAAMVCSLEAVAPVASADALFSQRPWQGYSTSDFRPIAAYGGLVQTVADDFILDDDALVTSVNWWGIYRYLASEPTRNVPADYALPDSDFTVRIFADNAGAPGSLLHEYATVGDGGRELIEQTLPGFGDVYYFAFSYDLPIPLELESGTPYWLSLVDDTSGFPENIHFNWLKTAPSWQHTPEWHYSHSADGLSGWRKYSATQGFSFELVPEPTTLTINVPIWQIDNQVEIGYLLLSGTTSVAKTGAGTLVLDATNTFSSSLSVNEGTVLAANPQALGTATLSVASGAAFAIAPEIGALNALQIEKLGTIAGTLDVGVGRFTLGSSSGSVESAKSLLVSGRNGGGWDGSAGITSTAAAADLQNGIVRSVGWKANSDGSVTVAYAAPGDTNLDGEVNVFDLVNVNGSGTYGRGNPSNWSQGDFDYNGVTNIFDMVQTNGAGVYGRGSYLPAAPTSVNAVPEPATYAMALAGLACGGYVVKLRRKSA